MTKYSSERSAAFRDALHLAPGGFALGGSTILMRRIAGEMAIAEDGERCLALLPCLTERAVPADVLLDLTAAAAHLSRGDLALANLRLVFSRLPAIRSHEEADRLVVAGTLLDDGMTPRVLMKHLGLRTNSLDDLRKYDQNQPRVPAGSGRESGRWGSGSATEARPTPGVAAGFLHGASPEIVGALARFAARFSVPTAVLGALFIPTPNTGGVTEGTLPDAPDIAFHKDGPAGLLTLTRTTGGNETKIVAQNRGGLYVDTQSGQSIGRDFGGQLYLSLDAVQDTLQDAREAFEDERTKPQAAISEDEPRLCPAPQKDTAHGSGADAKQYEADVHVRVNPLDPIPDGFAVKFINALTGQAYHFDDCFRDHGDLVDGDMKPGDAVDAKGPGYASQYSKNDKLREAILVKLRKQAADQTAVLAGTGRQIKWYFAEKEAANVVRRDFEKKFPNIVIGYMPPRPRP